MTHLANTTNTITMKLMSKSLFDKADLLQNMLLQIKMDNLIPLSSVNSQIIKESQLWNSALSSKLEETGNVVPDPNENFELYLSLVRRNYTNTPPHSPPSIQFVKSNLDALHKTWESISEKYFAKNIFRKNTLHSKKLHLV